MSLFSTENEEPFVLQIVTVWIAVDRHVFTPVFRIFSESCFLRIPGVAAHTVWTHAQSLSNIAGSQAAVYSQKPITSRGNWLIKLWHSHRSGRTMCLSHTRLSFHRQWWGYCWSCADDSRLTLQNTSNLSEPHFWCKIHHFRYTIHHLLIQSLEIKSWVNQDRWGP